MSAASEPTHHFPEVLIVTTLLLHTPPCFVHAHGRKKSRCRRTEKAGLFLKAPTPGEAPEPNTLRSAHALRIGTLCRVGWRLRGAKPNVHQVALLSNCPLLTYVMASSALNAVTVRVAPVGL
jgi:hypothetical protein